MNRDTTLASKDKPPPCVLLVEDDLVTARALTRLLQLTGYRVYSARTAAEAIEVARLRACDVLICDLDLPDAGSATLMRALAAGHPIPAIALTGHHVAESIIASSREGFLRLLVKPVRYDDVAQALRDIVLGDVAPSAEA
jgi:DNA-binding NtrC family response regulator